MNPLLKALRNIVIITVLFVIMAIVLRNSETARDAITPTGVPPPPGLDRQ